MKKLIDKGESFVYLTLFRIEISWWKRSYMGYFILPSISLCKTSNTRGFKIHFMKHTIDISYYLNN